MSGSLSEALGDRRGIAAVEFALLLPVFLLMLLAAQELGRAYYHANIVESSVRVATVFAARSEYPLTSTTQAQVANLLKTGSLDGSEPYVVSGWSEPEAQFQITTSNFSTGGENVPIVRLSVSVPFEPIMSGLMSFFGFNDYTIEVTHEQARIGD